MSFKKHFSRCLGADPERLHFAAHSHHPWPDVAFDAHARAALDACELLDFKWEKVFAEVIPRAQAHVARHLGLSDPATVAFGPNTHGLVSRVFSCIARRPVRILATDGEFHSFERQCARWEEAGLAGVERVPLGPFSDFPDRFLERARTGEHDLIYVSEVFYGSGLVFDRVAEVAVAAGAEALVVIDGYHAFFARPVDVSGIQDRVFWTAGGYKYAMSGEGACFLHCPEGFGERPVDTGWYAGFGELTEPPAGSVAYARDGSRFLGATFDPTGLYRFHAVMDLWDSEGVTPAAIHAHVRSLQERFLERLEGLGHPHLRADRLLPGPKVPDRGNFFTFRTREAASLHRALRERNVVTDHRGDRLRIGFGIYQDPADVDALAARLAEVGG